MRAALLSNSGRELACALRSLRERRAHGHDFFSELLEHTHDRIRRAQGHDFYTAPDYK